MAERATCGHGHAPERECVEAGVGTHVDEAVSGGGMTVSLGRETPGALVCAVRVADHACVLWWL